MRELETIVRERIRETASAATLVLGTPEPVRGWKAGQFLTIDPHQFRALAPIIDWFEAQKGRREPARAYSLSSIPDNAHLAFTVKEEPWVPDRSRYPPILSSFLAHALGPGDELIVRGFTGAYVLEDSAAARSRRIVHLCAGSGIVPNFSILKNALVHRPELEHVLLYSNRNWEQVIFREALDALSLEHRGRLTIRYVLTRDPGRPADRPEVLLGRIDRDLLAEVLGGPGEAEVFVCGPGTDRWDREAAAARGGRAAPRFVEAMQAYLWALEVPPERIHLEIFG